MKQCPLSPSTSVYLTRFLFFFFFLICLFSFRSRKTVFDFATNAWWKQLEFFCLLTCSEVYLLCVILPSADVFFSAGDISVNKKDSVSHKDLSCCSKKRTDERYFVLGFRGIKLLVIGRNPIVCYHSFLWNKFVFWGRCICGVSQAWANKTHDLIPCFFSGIWHPWFRQISSHCLWCVLLSVSRLQFRQWTNDSDVDQVLDF